jgi:hypothetical protein
MSSTEKAPWRIRLPLTCPIWLWGFPEGADWDGKVFAAEGEGVGAGVKDQAVTLD